MEGNMLKEISYLTRLIEQHQKTTTAQKLLNYQDRPFFNMNARVQQPYNGQPPLPNLYSTIETQRQIPSKYSYVKPQPPSGKVLLNPNFKPKNRGIHVNPKIRLKPSVHVNPKMMNNFSAQKFVEKQSSTVAEIKEIPNQSVTQAKIERSVHVNPRLIKELSSTKRNAAKCGTSEPENKKVILSKTKLERSNATPIPTPKKLSNSNLISLSRRKLIRIRRNSRGSFGIPPANPGRMRRMSNSGLRKTKVSTKYKLVIENVISSGSSNSVLKTVKNNGKAGMNKYKIDRTQVQTVKRRLSIGKTVRQAGTAKNSGSTMGLVRIGGILYKSSRNQLVRSSNDPSPSKKKRCIINVKGDRFVMASNGKKLRRLNSTGNGSRNTTRHSPVSRVDIGGMTFVEKTPNVLVRSHNKNYISNKVKQRSIQILRNKMRKNNQPCLIFQRFGYCAGQVKETCPKLHDKKQVALCRNFLQGKCLLDDCKMSHDVGPEKMPTCKYFLEGCCIRDPCPYLHVKVSPNTPVCTQFLRGYCAEANKCKHRHVYVCPEFDRKGKCAKGKYCPYPHKSHLSAPKKTRKLSRKKIDHSESLSASLAAGPSSHVEDRKRYYDEAGSLEEDFEKRRENILRKIEVMKGVQVAELGGPSSMNAVVENLTNVNVEEEHSAKNAIDTENQWPRRPPIGNLPAYIPIN